MIKRLSSQFTKPRRTVMPKRVAVLDFDGTITDAEEEAKPFVKGYMGDLCLLVRLDAEKLDLLVQSAEKEIASHPEKHGWFYDGVMVASSADPYLHMQAVARNIFDQLGLFPGPNPSERKYWLERLFSRNYPLSGIAFKPGAGQMLSGLCTNKDTAAYIVTNSSTEGVCKKILALSKDYPELAGLCGQVIGGAQKYVIGGRPEHLKYEKITIPGLSRLIYVKRSAYYDILENIREKNNIGWDDMTVIGDIFELDLVLPFELGAGVGLVANKFTPQYELDFFNSQRTRPAKIINSLSEVLPFVLR